MGNEYARQQIRNILMPKLAEATPDQLGMAPPGGDPAAAGGMPPGGAPPGMPPGAPMDPSMMGPPPGPPPDLQTIAAQGDPVAQALLDIQSMQQQMLNALKLIMDQAQLKAPASQLLETMAPPKPTQPKTAEEPPQMNTVESFDDEDLDAPFETPSFVPPGAAVTEMSEAPQAWDSPPATWPQGRSGRPGDGGAYQLNTNLSPKPVGAGRTIVDILKRGA